MLKNSEKFFFQKISPESGNLIILLSTALILGGVLFWVNILSPLFFPEPPVLVQLPPKKIEIPPDISSWKTFKDANYDFEIKYPSEWEEPRTQKTTGADFAYEYTVSFGTTETLEGNSNEGFTIYISKRSEAEENKELGECIVESPENSAKTTAVQSDTGPAAQDLCLLYKLKEAGESPTFYTYQFMGQKYEYDLHPSLTKVSESAPPRTKKIFLFESAAQTFTLDFETIAKKAAAAERLRLAQIAAAKKAKIKADYAPPTRSWSTCPHHTKGSISGQGKHVDEDCCPDPDEWPNLRCIYRPDDYKTMLKDSPPTSKLGYD